MKTLLGKWRLPNIILTFVLTITAIVAVMVTAFASESENDQPVLPSPTGISPDSQNSLPLPDYLPTPIPISMPTPTYPGPEINSGTGYTIDTAGPSTRGCAIEIADKTVQLPDDAEIEGVTLPPIIEQNPLGQSV